MQVTTLGYALIPLGLILAYFNNRYLLWAAVFFAPFGASSVANFDAVHFGLQPSYYFAALFMIKELLPIFGRGRIIIPNRQIILFVAYCFFSAVFTLIFRNKIEVWWGDEGYYMLQFTSHNITQLSYLAFCFLTYAFAKNYLHYLPDRSAAIERIVRIELAALIYVCFWGVYQYLSTLINMPFSLIFNERIGVGHSYLTFFDRFLRAYSVMPEPSMLALYLCPMIAFVVLLPRSVLRYGKLALTSLMLVTGFISFSVSFVFGSLAAFLFSFRKPVSSSRRAKARPYWAAFIIFTTILFVFGALMLLSEPLRQTAGLFFDNLKEKVALRDFSGEQRSERFLLGIDVLKKSFGLGVGYGTMRTTDLFSTLLANIGVIGLGLFLAYLFTLSRRLAMAAPECGLAAAFKEYFIVLFFVAFLFVSEPYFLFIWINLALAESICAQAKGTGAA